MGETKFGLALRLIMETKNLKQQHLSDMTGIPRSRISEYVTGRREPSFENFIKIIEAVRGVDSPDPYGLIVSIALAATYKFPVVADWLAPHLNDLSSLDEPGQKAVIAAIQAFKKND